MLVVRDQNKIMDFMNEIEMQLFSNHLKDLDMKLKKGLTSLHWSQKVYYENFVKECRAFCKEIYKDLEMFKENTKKISNKCLEIASRKFIKLDKRKPNEVTHFYAEQEKHLKIVKDQLTANINEIRNILVETYKPFLP